MSFETAMKTMEVHSIDLFTAEVTNRVIPNNVDPKDLNNFYTATINNTTITENELWGYCDITVRKEAASEIYKEVSASYFFHAEIAKDVSEGLANDLFYMICRNNVWPYFVQLVSQMGAHANLQLPKLPYTPDHIGFEEEE